MTAREDQSRFECLPIRKQYFQIWIIFLQLRHLKYLQPAMMRKRDFLVLALFWQYTFLFSVFEGFQCKQVQTNGYNANTHASLYHPPKTHLLLASVGLKPGSDIGNRNLCPISVLKPKLNFFSETVTFFPKMSQKNSFSCFSTSLGDIQ